MKELTILVPAGEGNNLSSIAGAYKIFSKANEIWIGEGRQPMFRIRLAGVSRRVEYFDGLFTVQPHMDISEVAQTDLIIIPSLNHRFSEALAINEAAVAWLKKMFAGGAEIAGICTGVFLLAATGLLDGKNCSTHWSAADSFRTMFPKVTVQADRLITDENGIYTNGGAYSFLNLMIYLVEKFYDRPTAVLCAKIFQIEADRNSQSEFIVFAGQKHHDDDLVQQAQEFIEKNWRDKISITALSARFHVGRRNFDRRFSKATGNTPRAYAQRVKVENAKKAFETNRKTINEVMYETGYSDVKAFREVFRKITGMSPLAYKGKYYKNTGA